MRKYRGLWLLASLAVAQAAVAQVTIAVNSTAQEVTVTRPTGIANANCTLGEAILAANTRTNVDACLGVSTPADPITLVLVAGTYDFNSVGTNVAVGSVNAPFALPTVTNSIAIVGNGAVLQRPLDPATPAMGFFHFGGVAINFSASGLSLIRGVRGLTAANSPDAFFDQDTSGFAQFRLTDVNLVGAVGTMFQISATGTMRLERVAARGGGGRTARATLTGIGPGPTSIQVIDSQFTDTRGALGLNAGNGSSGGSILVSGSSFLRNRASTTGLGLRISCGVGGVSVSLSGNRFEQNFGTNGAALDLQFSGTSTVSTVALANNVFLDNVATAAGGALRLFGSTPAVYRLTIQGDRYEGNLAQDGGAINLAGSMSEPVVVTETSFIDNVATNGAAIVIAAQDITVPRTAAQITRSAFLDNVDFGGVSALVFAQLPDHTIVIDNSTLAGNFATDELLGTGGNNNSYSLEALTVTNNAAATIIEVSTGSAALRNSVIFANPGAAACETGTGGTIQIGGGNYIQDASCDGFAQVLNPLLGPLALNGGTTLNRLPLPGSLLVNSGVVPVLQPLLDQRGQPRVRFAVADIGSVESDNQLVFANGFETTP